MANVAVMEREVDNLRKQLEELRAIQSRSRLFPVVFIIIMVVMFAVFAVATSARIHGNFTREAVNKAVAENTQALIPQLTHEAQLAASDVFPVYRDLAIERFKVVGPEVAQETLNKLRDLPKENLDAFHSRLEASMDRMIQNVSPDLHQLLAQLPDGREQEVVAAFHKHLVDDVNKRGEAVAQEQVTRLQTILNKFDVVPEANASKEDLERDFVHGLLMMADYELMYGGEDEFFEAPGAQVKPPLAPATAKAPGKGAKPAPAVAAKKTSAKKTH